MTELHAVSEGFVDGRACAQNIVQRDDDQAQGTGGIGKSTRRGEPER